MMGLPLAVAALIWMSIGCVIGISDLRLFRLHRPALAVQIERHPWRYIITCLTIGPALHVYVWAHGTLIAFLRDK